MRALELHVSVKIIQGILSSQTRSCFHIVFSLATLHPNLFHLLVHTFALLVINLFHSHVMTYHILSKHITFILGLRCCSFLLLLFLHSFLSTLFFPPRWTDSECIGKIECHFFSLLYFSILSVKFRWKLYNSY